MWKKVRYYLREWWTGDFSGDLTGVRILDFVGVKLIRFEKSGSIFSRFFCPAAKFFTQISFLISAR